VSVLFLLFAGVVMSNPPVFIRDMNAEQAERGSHNAFAAAGMYAATTLFAIFMYMHRSKQERISKLGSKTNRNGATAESSSLGADGSDPFSVPLVSATNTAGATSASVSDSASTTRPTSSGKKKKTKNTNNATVTSI
jgi:hypothetical protein